MPDHFKIGHSKINSQTFLPKFIIDKHDNSLAWVDIAGLKDTDGDSIEFVIGLINKKLFEITSGAKFIIPLTQEQMELQRGMLVRE